MSRVKDYLIELTELIEELDELIVHCEMVQNAAESLPDYDDVSGSKAGYIEERDELINQYIDLVGV